VSEPRFRIGPEIVHEAVDGEVIAIDLATAVTKSPAANGSVEKTPFEPPRLERYNDMNDYFLLDPIHEVDTAGWPRPAA
jgi:hypothetical protein